jgi:hypothetical protein
MVKRYAVCIAVTLLLSVEVFAMGNTSMGNIGQTQSFDMYGSNPASVIGHGSSTSSNMADVDQTQNLKKLCSTILTQHEKSMLTQGSDVSAKCGSLRVCQEGSAQGFQNQLLANMGRKGMTMQGQSLEMSLQQTALKKCGSGSAEGSQGSLSEQSESVIGQGIVMNSSQTIGAIQTANISGSTGSNAIASNVVNIAAHQSQMSN